MRCVRPLAVLDGAMVYRIPKIGRVLEQLDRASVLARWSPCCLVAVVLKSWCVSEHHNIDQSGKILYANPHRHPIGTTRTKCCRGLAMPGYYGGGSHFSDCRPGGREMKVDRDVFDRYASDVSDAYSQRQRLSEPCLRGRRHVHPIVGRRCRSGNSRSTSVAGKDRTKQQYQPFQHGFRSRGTASDIHVYWEEPINTLDGGVVTIKPPGGGARTESNHPFGFAHLIVDALENGGNLVVDRANYHE